MGGDHMLGRGDMVPARMMYKLVKLLNTYSIYRGNATWDTSCIASRCLTQPERDRAIGLLKGYLAPLKAADEPKGWKLPETILAYPFITDVLPDAHYIYWVRNPKDVILGKHLTDDLMRWNVYYPQTNDVLLQRAYSWKYQYDIIKSSPKPKHFIQVRFEDYVLHQDEEIERLEKFLELSLNPINVNSKAVGRWKKLEDPGKTRIDFLKKPCLELGYTW
jgi:hypothetical protein